MRQSSNSLSLGLHCTALNARWFLPMGAWSKILMYIFICVLWIHVYLNTLYIVQWIHVHLNTLYVVQWIHVVSLPWEPDPRSWSPKLGTIPLGIEYRLTPPPPPPYNAAANSKPHFANTYSWTKHKQILIFFSLHLWCSVHPMHNGLLAISDSIKTLRKWRRARDGGSAYQQIICYNPVQKQKRKNMVLSHTKQSCLGGLQDINHDSCQLTLCPALFDPLDIWRCSACY